MLTTGRQARAKAVIQVARETLKLSANGEKAKYGAAKLILSSAQLVYPWITRHQVNSKIKVLQQRGEKSRAQVVVVNTVDTTGGRPKGTTVAASRNMSGRKRKALNAVTLKFNKLKQTAKAMGTKLMRGELDSLISTVLIESGLSLDDPSFTISKETVRSRLKGQTNLTKSVAGIESPMAPVEPLKRL